MDGIEEAIDAANNTNYGLQAGIFTNDINKAFTAAKSIDATMMMNNK